MSSITTAIQNDYIINKKHKSLVRDILSYSKLPSYFLSYDFIIHLMRFGNILRKLNLHPIEYDYVETLQALFLVLVKDPLTKEVISIDCINNKFISNYLNNILDILFELVELLKIPLETQNMLLSLVPNNCEILFKILSNLDVIDDLDINFLFNNYNYLLRNNIELIQNKFLLNNDITEEINKQLIKQAVKEDIRTLLFIPDHKLSSSKDSYDIIKYAVQNNGFALKYIKSFFIWSKKYKNNKQIIINIIKIAVQQNGLALQFVDIEYLTDRIIELAVQNNGFALEFVDEKYLTDKIIEFAVQQNGLALQFINIYEEETYILTYEICKLAVQNNALAIEYIPDYNLTDEICKIAIQSNGLALLYVPCLNKTKELCTIAVQNNALALQYVYGSRKTKKLCMIAVQSNSCALQYVPVKFQTEEIINIALQSNYRALKYIDKDILTDEIIDLAFQYKIKQIL